MSNAAGSRAAPPVSGEEFSRSTVPVPSAAPAPRRVIDMIGNTQMIDLSDLVGRPGVRLLGKAEFANPGGSVKDRPALAMVREVQQRLGSTLGSASVGGTAKRLLDATSGNTGIALAMIGAALGLPVTLCLPANASPERKLLLRAYGAEAVLTDPLEGSDGAIREARRRLETEPERYVYLDQYGNAENWHAHYRTTGPEIWQQTGGEITHFITGVGTSGTFMGVGRYLRERDAGVQLISVQPDGPLHGLEGLKHMESALVPAIYDPELADEAWEVDTDDAYAMVLRLARGSGLRLGVSAGANVHAALRLARRLGRGTVVTVLCDNADKYLSEPFWDDGPVEAARDARFDGDRPS